MSKKIKSDSVVEKIIDWKANTTPADIHMALFERCRAERINGINVRTDGANAVFPVMHDKEACRAIKVDSNGKPLAGEKDLVGGEFIVIGHKTPRYIVKDILSGIVIFNATFASVAVYSNPDNLKDVAGIFPDARVVVGEFDNEIVKGLPSHRLIFINRFGDNKCESNIFKGRSFLDVRDYYLEGGDVNIMLNTEQESRMVPLWWCEKRKIRVEWLIEGVLQKGPCLATLVAPPNAGKTYIAIHTAMSIAAGLPTWFGGHKIKQGRVLYMLREGTAGISSRLQCWLEQHNITDPSRVPFYLDTVPFSFDNDKEYDEFSKLFEEHFGEVKPDLVVIDTLNLYMEGDENSTQDMTKFVKNLKAFTLKYNTTILLVHHTGLSNLSRGRGSSAMQGAVDIEYIVSNDGKTIEIEQTKTRNSEFIEPVYVKLEKHLVEAFRDEKTGEVPSDCILVETTSSGFIGKKEIIGEKFLVEFCVAQAKSGEEWKVFTRNQIYEYWKKALPSQGKKVAKEFNPKQETGTLSRLVKNQIITEIQRPQGAVTKNDELNITYKVIGAETISEVERLIAESSDGYSNDDPLDDE